MNKPDHSSGSALTERIFDLLEQAELADDAIEMRQLLNLVDDENVLSPGQQISLYYYRAYLAKLNNNLEVAIDKARLGLELAQKYQFKYSSGRMNFALGNLYNLIGHSSEAIACLKEARTLLENSEELYIEAEIHEKLTTAYINQGDYSSAQKEASAGLEIRQQTSDIHGKALSLQLLGRIYNSTGRCHEARDLLTEAVEIFRRHGDATHEAITLVTLGIANRNLGRMDDARKAYLRAIGLAKERELVRTLANATNNLGALNSLSGRLDEALEQFEAATRMHREQGNTLNAGLAYNNVGGIHTQRGEYARAEEISKEVLTSFRKLGHRSGVGIVLFDLGTIQFLQGRIEDGQKNCVQGIEIAIELGERRQAHRLLHELSWFLTVYGEMDSAARCFARAGEYFSEGAEVENSRHILAVQAWHQFNLENAEKSLALAEAALRQSEEKGATVDTLLAHLIRGRVLLSMGKLDEAGEELLSTRQGYLDLRMPFYEAISCRALADYYHKINQSEKRDAIMKEGLGIARRIGATKLTPWFERMLNNFVYKG